MPDRNEDSSLGILYYGTEPLTSVPLYYQDSAAQEAAREYAIVHPKRMIDPLVLFIYAILSFITAVALLLSIVWST